MKNILVLALVTWCAVNVFNWQYSRIDKMAVERVNGYSKLSQLEKDLRCLSDNVTQEAGIESIEGKLAVAQVTMNRVRSKKFGDGVCGVVYQKNQFSWTIDTPKNRHNYAHMSEKQYKESYEIAKKVLIEKFEVPSLRNALWYHATYVSPKWAQEKKKIIQIGRHIFYA